MPTPSQRSFVLIRLGHALLLVGRTEDAHRFGARALEFATCYGEPGAEAKARLLLGEVALRGATPATSLDHAELYVGDALAIAGKLGSRPLTAHCHAGLAKLHQRVGESSLATDHFTRAAAMYREMDMPFWLQRLELEMDAKRVHV